MKILLSPVVFLMVVLLPALVGSPPVAGAQPFQDEAAQPQTQDAAEKARAPSHVEERDPPHGAQTAVRGETIDVTPLADLVILSNGRMKTLPTHARETVRRLFGQGPAAGLDALETYLSILYDPDAWVSRPCFTVEKELAQELFGRSEVKVSFEQVSEAHSDLVGLIQSARGMDPMGRMGSMRAPSSALQKLGDQAMQLLFQATTLQDLKAEFYFLPMPDDPGSDWLSPGDLHFVQQHEQGALPVFESGLAAFEQVKEAYLSGDQDRFGQAAASLIALQRRTSDQVLSQGMVSLENLYYAVDVRKVGLILFAACALAYLLSARSSAGLRNLAFCLLLAGIVWNGWIVGGRTAIGGRLPLKNLNEVYLVVLFAVPLIGLLLERLFKNALYGGISAALTAIGFTGSLFLPPQGYDITPLMAILISPWREVHILTIMFSYAVMLVAAGLHLAFLLLLVIQPNARTVQENKVVYSPLAGDLNHKAYLMVVWGFFLLTVGIATGAAWAHSSWGRYWGWDPKEVWATIAWAVYALFLHLRLFYRTRPEWLALINLIGFAAILFTYFGVTYLLSGLHAYA